jgi:hypothetical protein
MKVLFLDHDGVICLPDNWGSRHKKQTLFQKKHGFMSVNKMDVFHRFDSFDKKAVNVLNDIISQTNLEIVVSSDWRLSCTLEEMQLLYQKEGVLKSPIDFTPVFKNIKDIPEDFPWKMSINLEQQRSFEIKTWLNQNKNVTNWVAIDDLDLRSEVWGLENFVHCSRKNEGIKQLSLKDKILKFL